MHIQSRRVADRKLKFCIHNGHSVKTAFAFIFYSLFFLRIYIKIGLLGRVIIPSSLEAQNHAPNVGVRL